MKGLCDASGWTQIEAIAATFARLSKGKSGRVYNRFQTFFTCEEWPRVFSWAKEHFSFFTYSWFSRSFPNTRFKCSMCSSNVELYTTKCHRGRPQRTCRDSHGIPDSIQKGAKGGWRIEQTELAALRSCCSSKSSWEHTHLADQQGLGDLLRATYWASLKKGSRVFFFITNHLALSLNQT